MTTKQEKLIFISDFIKKLNDNGLAKFCIAGGCIRDIEYGKEIKDIDIFYWDTLPLVVPELSDIIPLENNGNYVNNICTHKSNYYGIPVDFIKVAPQYKTNVDVLQSFPISISQIGIDQHGCYIYTKAFVETQVTKVIKYHVDWV